MMSRWNYVDMLPLKCEFCKKDFKQVKRESEFYLRYDNLILIMCPYCDTIFTKLIKGLLD